MRLKSKKAMIIGIDCLILPIVDRLTRGGKLPNIKALMNRGVTGQTWPEYPTATQPNWNVVQTGAYPGTSGIYDMTIHVPGDPLDEVRIGASFDSETNKAETIWQLADCMGKKCFLFKFPGTWPPSIKNGYQIDGHCAPAGILHHNYGSSKVAIHPAYFYSTEEFRRYHKTEFKPAAGWRGLPGSKQPPLETELPIAPGEGQAMFYGVIIDSEGKGYDVLIIDQNKDSTNPAGIIKVGEYSPMIKSKFAVPDKPDEGAFRVKLMELSPDGKRFKLYSTQVYPTKGFTYPESLGPELVSKFGPFIEYTGLQPYALGWIDDETFLTDAEYHTRWMEKAAGYVFSNYDWDLFMMQWHPVDFSEHLFFEYNPSCFAYDPKVADQKRSVVDRCYMLADELIGGLVSHADDDTLVAIVSDHGVVPAVNEFMINNILAKRGYLSLKKEIRNGREWLIPDWSKTKAWAQAGWSVQIHLNLKGRDPEGIVDPGEEYDKIRESIIHDLHNVIDPKTGKRPVLMALRKEHAMPYLHPGELSGDVIYVLDVGYEASGVLRTDLREFEEPHYSGIHSSVLPNAKLDEGTIQSMFIIAGPGIKKGIRMKNETPLVNFAPTIAYALGLPPLADADGMPLISLFED
ncbi:MAG: alkaline phosphatase family protein [Deltaproteobacteria bacterium]|nr:alkaline phosphatase family protein [Deltaproteobacteria bacterium]